MRRLLLLISLLVLTAFPGVAQDTIPLKQMRIGITASPDYCFRSLTSRDISIQYLANSRENDEEFKFGYSAGINFTYQWHRYLKIHTGLYYSNKGEQIKEDEMAFGPADPDLPVSGTAVNCYKYIDLPLKVIYAFNPRIPDWFVSAGLVTGFFLQQRQTLIYEYEDGSAKGKVIEGDKSDYTPFAFAATIGMGVDQPLDFNKQWFLHVEPHYQHMFTPSTSSTLKSYLYSFGLNIGIYKIIK